ncbi:hypothetical protein A1O7_06152 [Cladophialophora yegresii CBS 114405]|uniref:Uncharacterized protein n=1 Tax=Cladophialophora yegresii CBS 114405 TaxID=1182544 RepID=W9VT26_9EURO|nr:uncharacterized protein A1O7_06152 [Cladophialophora yegresii CBS 114405]EXJ58723.1 hypothetical protein A1O7_06152 [Cladophialophora yegresii CBS 114405]
MLCKPVPSPISAQQEKAAAAEVVKDHAFVSDYNETDYSDFLYLAPPLTAEFLPLAPKAAADRAAAPSVKNVKTRPAETFNTGTTPPPVAPAEGLKFQKEYFSATYPPSGARSPIPEASEEAKRERRPSFVEVTPVKVHHEHEAHKDAHRREKRHSHSSHSSESMNWWPENESLAQHEWVDRDEGAEEEDVIEEEVWSDAFYE